MSYLTQKTIKKKVSFNGIALHSGLNVNLSIKPADENFGIVFKRIDLKTNNLVYPSFMNVTNTSLNTTIENEFGAKVSTIEHLMGAFYGLGIDNAIVEVDNEEIPILDGSAKVFVDEILKSGIEISEMPIKMIRINKKIELTDGPKFISIEPSEINLVIDFELKYKNPLIGTQSNVLSVYENDLTDIFNSRTFCLYEDINNLREIGLAKGGSLDNAVVVKDNEVLNENGLRNKKEFVNHKILDCMGDLYLSGYKIIGKLVCSQGGHKLTNDLLRKVFSDKRNYSVIEIEEKSVPHSYINKFLLKSIA